MTETLEGGQVVPVPFEGSPATISDFITAYGRREALELSYLDAPFMDDSDIDANRFVMALKNAHETIQSYHIRASEAGKIAITGSAQRAQLVIARHYLDIVRRRDEVRADFEDVLKFLDEIVNNDSGNGLAATFGSESAVSYTVSPRKLTPKTLEPFETDYQ